MAGEVNLAISLAQFGIVLLLVFAQWRVRVHHRRLVEVLKAQIRFYQNHIAMQEHDLEQMAEALRKVGR